MRRALARRATLIVMIALAMGCGGRSSSPAEPAAQRDSIVLLSVDPPEGTHVQLGGRVQVVARFRYTFAQPAGGKIEVLVTPLPFGLPLLTDPLLAQVDVAGQEGEATLRFAILLDDPDHQLRPGPIGANLTLFPQGQNQSTTNVQIRYEVVP
jgi:hypothetical protein